jgi:hypothetical protein
MGGFRRIYIIFFALICGNIIIGVFIAGISPKIKMIDIEWNAQSPSCIPFQEDTNPTDYGIIYYVSNMHGSDANTGISPDSPWQTLEKLGTQTFNPYDRILLRKGDIWENQSLFLYGSGNSSAWITLGAYGEDAENPKIFPGVDQLWGLQIANASGWHLQDLEIGYCQTGISIIQNNNQESRDFWIQNCYIHHIEGIPVPQRDNFSMIFPDLWCAMGIIIYTYSGPWIKNVAIENTRIENVDLAFRSKFVQNLYLDQIMVANSYRGGIWIEETNSGILQNSRIIYTGSSKGMWWGTRGFSWMHVIM